MYCYSKCHDVTTEIHFIAQLFHTHIVRYQDSHSQRKEELVLCWSIRMAFIHLYLILAVYMVFVSWILHYPFNFHTMCTYAWSNQSVKNSMVFFVLAHNDFENVAIIISFASVIILIMFHLFSMNAIPRV